jgi:hypothetical protein
MFHPADSFAKESTVKRLPTMLMVVACLVLLGAEAPEFKEFKSEAGKFKALFPGKPKETAQKAVGIDLKMFTIEENNGAMVIAYADMPLEDNITEEEIQTRLDGARTGMVNNVKAELKSEKKITIARGTKKYPGREILADLPDQKGQLRARIFLVDKRLYQIMVVGNPDFAKSANAAKFIDSLQLTP